MNKETFSWIILAAMAGFFLHDLITDIQELRRSVWDLESKVNFPQVNVPLQPQATTVFPGAEVKVAGN